MIEIKHLSLIYPKGRDTSSVQALRDVSATFADDSITVIVGASGSGKTSLLHSIAGFTKYQGDIIIDGINANAIAISDRNMSLVNQSYVLYPHMSIFDNIAFPLKSKGADKKEIVSAVNETADFLGLGFLLTRKPKELSGGQQQRVALARAMVKRPKIYLFDEPLSNVSGEFRDRERQMIRKAVKRYHSLAIYITHNLKEATSLADHIIVLNEGEIIYEGTPKEILQCDNPIVKELLEASNAI